jgi:putative ABC transport system ATP-binding protein
VTQLILEAADLTKTYRRGPERIHALAGVSISIARGEVVVLVGPSGSGKTTLLSILAGWERPDEGTVTWPGIDDGPGVPGWDAVAVVPQTFGLVEELSIRENVEIPLRLTASVDHRDRVASLLQAFGLTDLADRLPDETSLGEQQRTALARGLVRGPRLLMADEPTGHQDAHWTRGVLDAIGAAAAEGTAVLMATHHRALVRFADRVVAMADGRARQVDAGAVVGTGDEL